MHEINVHTIADLQSYVRSYELPKLSIRVLGQIYERALVALPGKPAPSVKDHRKARNPYYLKYGAEALRVVLHRLMGWSPSRKGVRE